MYSKDEKDMQSRRKAVLRLTNLLKKKGISRIAIYGTGDNSAFLLKEIKDIDIVCILDGKKTNGEFYGHPIIPIESTNKLGINTIVIAAEYKIEKIIYDRIHLFCKANEICVVGMHMGDIAKSLTCTLIGYDENEYVSQEKLLAEIEAHEIISFDIFDTLLMRKTLFPMDVFDLVGNSIKEIVNKEHFKSCRMRAELNLLHRGEIAAYANIYNELKGMMDASDDMIQLIARRELEIERAILAPRYDVRDAFFYALRANKNVYLISDMYFGKRELEEILSQNGIKGYRNIYVSSEYNETKNDGLFSIFKEEVPGNTYLHIGNDPVCDGLAAICSGIDSCILPSAYDTLKKSKWKDICLYLSGVNNRNLVGLAISKTFNSPFSVNNKKDVMIGSIEEYAHCFLAPIYTAFMIWFVHKVHENNYDSILFAARDGYFIKKLYDWYRENVDTNLPQSIYFFTSRKACIGADICGKKDIEHHKHCYDKKILMEILSLEDEEFSLDEEWINHSQAKRNNYLKYIDELGLSPEKNYCFFELIAGGTSQYHLSRIFFNNLQGIYFMYLLPRNNSLQNVPKISSFDQYFGLGEYTIDISNYKGLLLELVCSSPDGSLREFDKEGKPVFAIDQRDALHLRTMKCMQDAIFNYFKYYVQNLYVDSDPINIAIPKRLTDYRFACKKNADMFDFIFYEDLLEKKWNVSDIV